jgi:NADPH-dependent 2,4-dienoyl-CoA reductase/sulfur reductase-like enzyme
VTERIVIVGGDAGGMAAISQIRKRQPHVEIVVIERGRWTSYSACGIPYVAGGIVDGPVDRLVARTPQAFRDRDHVDVRMGHEVLALDLAKGEVEVVDHGRPDRAYRLAFDQLLLGTGGRAYRPEVPGADLPFVSGAHTLADAEWLAASTPRHVTVLGGGPIGIEIAEAFVHRKVPVTLLERGPQVLRGMDPEMAAPVVSELRSHGVDVRFGVDVRSFEQLATDRSDGPALARVHSNVDPIDTDLVVLGVGTAPESSLAASAGIALGVKGSIAVDRRQRTSVDGVWAAGDCCQSTDGVTGSPTYVSLGTVANKMSRVAGINMGGGYASTPPTLSTGIVRAIGLEVSRTGLTSSEAVQASFDIVTATISARTAAAYMPESAPITVRLIAERNTGRLLGGQIHGGRGAGKRIDTVVMAITAGMDAAQLLDADLAYAPPFSPVWDPVAVCARELLKQL